MRGSKRSRGERRRWIESIQAVGLLFAIACAPTSATPPGGERAAVHREPPVAGKEAATSPLEASSYLEPNYGETGYAHVTPADMPWRIAIA